MQNVNSTIEFGSVFSEQLRDIEYNGELNRAAQQGAKFALLLSMLEQNILFRPHIAADEAQSPASDIPSLSHYRRAPLAANVDYWQEVVHTERFIQRGELQNARLWLAMHPEPLSLFNDAKHIPDEVLENCALTTRQRVKPGNNSGVAQDPTKLFDLLAGINQTEPIATSA
ncbi:VC2046/SO_2500 family protein [Flavobacterium sp. W21_SRS_FM6]|uniref:VC2046/SO_2500 family protein n=1 Tax=Flavobacterium sp. W21_SRS_FM6 TaxID=3240268 RepID=UPI003F93CFC4